MGTTATSVQLHCSIPLTAYTASSINALRFLAALSTSQTTPLSHKENFPLRAGYSHSTMPMRTLARTSIPFLLLLTGSVAAPTAEAQVANTNTLQPAFTMLLQRSQG